MIEAKIIADSLAPSGKRLTTFQLKYPRFIHAEFMTHRVFSRNASSSRAIPVNKMIDQIEKDWAEPICFHKNTKGMQGKEVIMDSEPCFEAWQDAKDDAVKHARRLVQLGVHKQQANRILEPFMHISVVCTATEYDNFFALRHHHMAQPEIERLAQIMYDLYVANKPQELKGGDWHLPYVGTPPRHEYTFYTVEECIKMSVARCARVSYLNHDGTETTFEQDAKLYDRLLGSQPIHASPAEHQAMAVELPEVESGNLRGWIQYRKTLQGENVSKFVPGMFDDGDR